MCLTLGPDGELSVLGVRSSGSTSSSAVTSSRFLLQPGTVSLRLNISTALSSTCSLLFRSEAATPSFRKLDPSRRLFR